VKAYRGWEIEGVGGYCTIRHFWADKGGRAFWMFLLREVKATIDGLEDGSITWDSIEAFYRRPLYN